MFLFRASCVSGGREPVNDTVNRCVDNVGGGNGIWLEVFGNSC